MLLEVDETRISREVSIDRGEVELLQERCLSGEMNEAGVGFVDGEGGGEGRKNQEGRDL